MKIWKHFFLRHTVRYIRSPTYSLVKQNMRKNIEFLLVYLYAFQDISLLIFEKSIDYNKKIKINEKDCTGLKNCAIHFQNGGCIL